jgi:hypothetical protein
VVSGTTRPSRLTTRRAVSKAEPGPAQHPRRVDRPAGQRAEPQHELVEHERLGQVVVGAEHEPGDPVRRVPAAVSMRMRTSPPAAASAVHTWSPWSRGRSRSRTTTSYRFAVALCSPSTPYRGEVDRDAPVAQAVGDLLGQQNLVLDQQHPPPGHPPCRQGSRWGVTPVLPRL